MQLDINIEQLVANAVTAALAPEQLQPIITKNVEQAVKSAIDNAFSYNAPFTKHLNEKVREAMPTEIEDMGRFSDLVLKVISAHLNEHQNQFIQSAIQPKLERMLRKLPPRMKLSELVGMLVEDFMAAHERDDALKPTFVVERSTSTVLSNYWTFTADPSEDAQFCKIRAQFNDKGICYSLRVDGEDLQQKLLIGPTFNADALMLNLYTGGIVIELDREDFSDVYYPGSNDD